MFKILFRWDFIQKFTLMTLNIKQDKWAKMTGQDDQRNLILDFFEKKVRFPPVE